MNVDSIDRTQPGFSILLGKAVPTPEQWVSLEEMRTQWAPDRFSVVVLPFDCVARADGGYTGALGVDVRSLTGQTVIFVGIETDGYVHS